MVNLVVLELNNMKKYYFYFKKDRKKEPISYFTCETFEEAIEFFSKSKKLDPKTFLKIFDIDTK